MFSNWPKSHRVQVLYCTRQVSGIFCLIFNKKMVARALEVCSFGPTPWFTAMCWQTRNLNLVSGCIFYFINLQIELILFSFLVLKTIDRYFGIVAKLALGQTTMQLLENLEANENPHSYKSIEKQNLLSWSATSIFYSLNL